MKCDPIHRPAEDEAEDNFNRDWQQVSSSTAVEARFVNP